MTAGDGIVAVALGLGREVVEGGKCLAFCPRYPRNLMQFSSVEDILANSQTEFWALELDHQAQLAIPWPICAKYALDWTRPRRTEPCTRWVLPTWATTMPSMTALAGPAPAS